MGNLVEKLQNVMPSFCSIQQRTTFPQHLEINLYNTLYPNMEENTLGKRLKKTRLRMGLSQEQLAHRCNLSRGAIEGYETDWIYPSRNALLNLTKIIDKDYLCNDDYSKFILSDYIGKLKSWRNDNKLSMRKAAKLLNVPSSTYISWEKELYSISRNNYYKIKDKLNKTIDIY